jgi:hypothetical protein
VQLTKEPLATLTGTLDTEIMLPPTNGLVWLKMTVRPSLLGKLVSFLYKPPGITLRLRVDGGAWYHARFLPMTGPAGFLGAPLVTSNAMFGELLRSRADVGPLAGRSQIIRLEPDPGGTAMFEQNVKIVLEQLTLR